MLNVSKLFVVRVPLLCGQVKRLKRPYSPLKLSTKVDLKQIRPVRDCHQNHNYLKPFYH